MIRNLLRKIVPEFLLKAYHYCLAFLGALFYGFPSKKLIVVGITGTSGKSTVAELTSFILEKSGNKTASMSSVRFKIGDKEEENKLKMTMPGRFKIQKFLKQAVNEGCKFAVSEVTSEGIKQFRHKFIKFDIAVLTNLTPEHIESHGGFENYREAKSELFRACKNIHIINLDDENADYFWKIPAKNKIGFSRNEFDEVLPERMNMPGEFNKYNALAAVKTAVTLGVSLQDCRELLQEFGGIEGRMETIIEKPFKAIVDYAHTPEQLEKAYETINSKNLICVFGSCGGGRDKRKRPVLGRIAAKYCQKIILTNEDPYDEDPVQILSMIKSGVFDSRFPKADFYEIPNRREAIKKALSLAEADDIVIITGKGSEPWMCLANGKKIPWKDGKIVKEELSK